MFSSLMLGMYLRTLTASQKARTKRLICKELQKCPQRMLIKTDKNNLKTAVKA